MRYHNARSRRRFIMQGKELKTALSGPFFNRNLYIGITLSSSKLIIIQFKRSNVLRGKPIFDGAYSVYFTIVS